MFDMYYLREGFYFVSLLSSVGIATGWLFLTYGGFWHKSGEGPNIVMNLVFSPRTWARRPGFLY